MRKSVYKKTFTILIIIFISSCNPTKGIKYNQLLLDNNCLTIAAYIGPSGFAQSMRTLTNDWESILGDYNNNNTTTDDGETTTYTETNKNIQKHSRTCILVERNSNIDTL